VHGVGVSFKLPSAETVTPDVLASCGARNTTLIIEVKGGSNFDHDQLGRMETVTATDLRDAAYLKINDAHSHKTALVIVCNAEQFTSFVAAAHGRPVTIVSFDGSRFVFGGSPLPDVALQTAWSSAKIDLKAPPLNIIPFDQESDLGKVARTVLPEILALLISGSGNFSVDTILQKTHSICHGAMQSTGSGTEFSGIRNRVVEMVTEATKNEFSSWFTRIPGQRVWAFSKGISAELSSRTRDFKSLQASATTLIERLGGGGGVQLDLLDYSFEE
jgi:hypothetical protein